MGFEILPRCKPPTDIHAAGLLVTLQLMRSSSVLGADAIQIKIDPHKGMSFTDMESEAHSEK